MLTKRHENKLPFLLKRYVVDKNNKQNKAELSSVITQQLSHYPGPIKALPSCIFFTVYDHIEWSV